MEDIVDIGDEFHYLFVCVINSNQKENNSLLHIFTKKPYIIKFKELLSTEIVTAYQFISFCRNNNDFCFKYC